MIFPLVIGALPPSPEHITTLYSSLDPLSVSQNFAFYELYPEAPEGKKALKRGWALLFKDQAFASTLLHPLSLPPCDMQSIISFVNKQAHSASIELTEAQRDIINRIAASLGNRKLKGFETWNLADFVKLPTEEIDVARGVLLHQYEQEKNGKTLIQAYEANIDLMALQIKARLPKEASPEQMITAINRFIFQDMHFRFPPHSLYAKDIDLYTFLPSVLDSRLGVCLGVSILYLSLAQRLNLSLEIITPPGHIYVRYHEGEKVINIETTARGIDLPSETYLGLNTQALQQREMKEVVGEALVNQASVLMSRGEYPGAKNLYEKAALYMPENPRLQMLLGLSYLFCGNFLKGRKCFEAIKGKIFEGEICPESIPEDFLKGEVSVNALKAIFLSVDDNRESILSKQKELKQILKKYPNFRAGLMQLSVTWLQLGRRAEALQCLNYYHSIDPKDPIVEYYLILLNQQSLDYPEAWKHYDQLEAIMKEKNHFPKLLKSLHQGLLQASPRALP